MTKEEYINEKYEKYLYYWSNFTFGASVPVVLSLTFLDYLATPFNFLRFLVCRIITSICLIILFLLNRRKVDRIALLLSQSGSAVSAYTFINIFAEIFLA